MQNKKKPGYKSTEFWLNAAVTLAGLAMASGAVAEDSQIAQAIGAALAGLSALGYTAGRSSVKKAEK